VTEQGEARNLDTARAFIAEWGKGTWDDLRGAYEKYLAPDCVYLNSGLPPCEGRQAILGLIDGLAAAQSVGAIIADIRTVAASGDLVYSERSDRHLDAEGNHAYTVELLGVMRFRDGEIVQWREYFDPRPLLAAVGAGG
jgi:limonene-1,2-epoxide hydrolase